MNKYANTTAGGQIKSTSGVLKKIIINSHSSGTIQLNDGFTGTTAGDKAAGVLTFTGVVSDGETVTIGSEVYEFDTDASVTSGNILVDVSGGATASDAVTALAASITSDSAIVDGADGTGDTVDVTAKSVGVAGNSIATTTTCANASFGDVTLLGGTEPAPLICNTITLSAVATTGEREIDFHNICFENGLYLTKGGTVDLTVVYH